MEENSVDLKEMAVDLAVKGYNDIVDNEGDFNNNIKMMQSGIKMATDIAEKEAKLVTPEVKEDVVSLEKRSYEKDKAYWEAQRAKWEAAKAREESETISKDKKWDRGLKIAGITAGILTPIVGATITGAVSLILFKGKADIIDKTLKLNTVLQDKGYISGINNSKVVSDTFNEMLKK